MPQNSIPPPQVPLAFVAAALATLGATLLWLLAGSLAPLAVLHALVAGVFLMVAMGLIYQFVPVVAMAPLRWPYAAFVHLALAVAGTSCLVAGFAAANFALVRLGGSLHLGGIAIQIVLLAATLRGRKPPAPAAGAALSLLWLIATIGLGVWIANRLASGGAAGTAPGLHALIGLGGFFGTLITAVSLRLLRMFERVDLEARVPALAIAVSAATVVAVFAANWGGYVLLAAAVAVGVNVAAVARERDPAYQRETLAYAVISALGAIGAAAAYLRGTPTVAIALAIWFYIGCAVVGYLQRIVPFIWWIRRSRREGTRNIPTLAQMNRSPLGYAILAFWALAGCLWLLTPAAHVAAGIALVAWAGLLAQLARPFIDKRRPER